MTTDPLQLPLRDIHLPPAVSLWPPAPGWWMLLGLGVLIAMAFWVFRLIRRRGRLTRAALAELRRIEGRCPDDLGDLEFAAALSTLLRRVSISKTARSECAGLVGKEWLVFLESTLGDGRFTKGPGRVLIEAPYRPEAEINRESLLKLARDWLKRQ